MSFRKLALNVPVSLAASVLFWRFAGAPVYRLLHLYRLLYLGQRSHGSLAEDPEFYYTLVAWSLIGFGEALGLAFCLLGLACALGTPLGWAAEPACRAKARIWLWYTPAFFFLLEIVGRFQLQRWLADRGVLFPYTSFLRDFAPHLWWLLAAWLLTAPAILTGRGLYSFLMPRHSR